MSIVIKGVKMPILCGECPCWHDRWCHALKEGPGTLGTPIGWSDMPRPDWCPLVELPEKHGRLIDADALIAQMEMDEEQMEEPIAKMFAYAAISDVKHAPTIEPERKKGKWIHGRELSREMIGDVVTAIFYEGWECSECHCLVSEEREPLWKYCPNCGAKMEEGEQE